MSKDNKSDFIYSILTTTKANRARSLADSIEDSVGGVVDAAKKSKPINDAYGNSLTATGTEDKISLYSDYGFSNSSLNWPLWLALYNDSWVFRRAIDKPSQDMVNSGFALRGDQDYSRIYKAYNLYKFDLIQLLQWGALFGGSVAVMMFDGVNDEDMQKAIDPKKIKGKRMRLYVTDRWYGISPSMDTVTNMRDIDFGTPKTYDITFADGRRVNGIHHSYVLRYEHRTAPKLIKNGQLQGWGYAEGAHILNELSQNDQLKTSITSLVNKSLIEVIKMSGMRGVFMGADKGNEEQLRKRLEMVNWGRSYNSLTFLDKDDEYQQVTFSGLQGLADLLEKNMWQVAAGLEMQGILFGDLKGGLSQESDAMRRYAITIENRCDSYFRPVLQKLLTVLFIVYGIEGIPDFEFVSLVSEELNIDRMNSINSYAGLLQTLMAQGVISKYQAAMSINGFINNGSISIDFTEEQMNKLKYEEEIEILAAYRAAGKGSPENILNSQFPQGNIPSELPEKLEYLEGVGEPIRNEEQTYNEEPVAEAPETNEQYNE